MYELCCLSFGPHMDDNEGACWCYCLVLPSLIEFSEIQFASHQETVKKLSLYLSICMAMAFLQAVYQRKKEHSSCADVETATAMLGKYYTKLCKVFPQENTHRECTISHFVAAIVAVQRLFGDSISSYAMKMYCTQKSK